MWGTERKISIKTTYAFFILMTVAFHNLEEDTYKQERYAKYQSLELQKQVEQ